MSSSDKRKGPLTCNRRSILVSGVALGVALVEASCSSPRRQRSCVSPDGGDSVLVDLDDPCPAGTDDDIS